MAEMKKCPYCAEDIAADAVRCRYCRSRLTSLDPETWYRDHPEKRIAGVTAAVAHELGFPVSLVRLAFVVLTFIHLLGPMLYGALWLVIPFAPGEPSPLAKALDRATEIAELFRRDRDASSGEHRRGGNAHRSSLRNDLLS